MHWSSTHDEACPVTYWRRQLVADLEAEPASPYLLGAVPEYDKGGDQEAELCTCRPNRELVDRLVTLLMPKRVRPW